MVTGHGDNWERFSSLYYNSIPSGTDRPEFTLASSGETGIVPVNKANVLIADFNNDGFQDMIINGYDGSKDLMRVYYQTRDGKFKPDTNKPLFSIKDGGINMGDIDGDGNMDVVIAGYKGSDTGDAYGSPVRIYENRPGDAGIPGNRPPSAPAFVRADYREGMLSVTWGDAADDITAPQALRYNLYVKNNATGRIWMMIPADAATGRIKVGTDLQTSLAASVRSYDLFLPPGDYTVGVQALDQAYAGGTFATVSGLFSGVSPADGTHRFVETRKNGVRVTSERTEAVKVINVKGDVVAQGVSNKLIPLLAGGFYIVRVAGQSFKIVMSYEL
jgi:hypothetical protein